MIFPTGGKERKEEGIRFKSFYRALIERLGPDLTKSQERYEPFVHVFFVEPDVFPASILGRSVIAWGAVSEFLLHEKFNINRVWPKQQIPLWEMQTKLRPWYDITQSSEGRKGINEKLSSYYKQLMRGELERASQETHQLLQGD